MRYYSNTASQAVLVSPASPSDSVLSVDTVGGFPASFPFSLVIDPDTLSAEIVSVTAVAGTTLTVVRGEDNTAAVSHSAGAVVSHDHTGRDFQEPQSHIAASSGVHGLTGAVLGTTDTQTVTNKNFTSGTNMFPTSLATLTTAQTLTNKDLTSLTNTFAVSAKNPAGSMLAFGGSSAPTGWLICDGSAVSRTTYSDLFAVCGTTYGAGNGTTTFNLPDLRSRFPIGSGTFAALGSNEGTSAEASRTTAHTHNAGTLANSSDGSHTHAAGTLTTSDFTMNDTQNTTATGSAGRLNGDAHNITHNHNVTGDTGSAGSHTHNISGATASTSAVPYTSVNWIIKT